MAGPDIRGLSAASLAEVESPLQVLQQDSSHATPRIWASDLFQAASRSLSFRMVLSAVQQAVWIFKVCMSPILEPAAKANGILPKKEE